MAPPDLTVWGRWSSNKQKRVLKVHISWIVKRDKSRLPGDCFYSRIIPNSSRSVRWTFSWWFVEQNVFSLLRVHRYIHEPSSRPLHDRSARPQETALRSVGISRWRRRTAVIRLTCRRRHSQANEPHEREVHLLLHSDYPCSPGRESVSVVEKRLTQCVCVSRNVYFKTSQCLNESFTINLTSTFGEMTL